MQYKKIFEFLVWDNCNNNCKFCWQREKPRLFDSKKREMILREVLAFIRSDRFVPDSHILICGGEIFDKPENFDALDTFFCDILKFMMDGTIDLLYINTNLLYKDLTGVIRLLDRVKQLKLFDRLKFTTSYDIEGRFKSEEARKLMTSNLKLLTGIYKDLKVVTNTILTKQACEAVVSGDFIPSKFMEEHKCWINFIPYIVLDKNLAPERGLVFQALQIIDQDCPGYLDKYIPNMEISQEKLLYTYRDNDFQYCSCEMAECGHSVNFKRYSAEGTCFCCDLKEIFNG